MELLLLANMLMLIILKNCPFLLELAAMIDQTFKIAEINVEIVSDAILTLAVLTIPKIEKLHICCHVTKYSASSKCSFSILSVEMRCFNIQP